MALWRDLAPAAGVAVTRDAALQTQWRRIMALRIPGEENPGARIDTQSFSPIAIPLSGAKLIAWRPQGSGGEMELTLSSGQRYPRFFLAGALRDESAFVFAGP